MLKILLNSFDSKYARMETVNRRTGSRPLIKASREANASSIGTLCMARITTVEGRCRIAMSRAYFMILSTELSNLASTGNTYTAVSIRNTPTTMTTIAVTEASA